VTDEISTAYIIVQRQVPTMYFLGVTTGQSAMTRLFPLWAKVLHLAGAQLVGVDLPLQAEAEQYRRVVTQIKYDPLSLGALITSHKLDVWNAAQDQFDVLDSYAQLCHEVSCIVKHDSQIIGSAKDPINSGVALQHILGPQYWRRSGGHVLCLGAGGAGTAITVNLLQQPDPDNRPQRLIIVNDKQLGLEHLRAVVEQLSPTVAIDYVLNADPRRNDQLMAELPPGSLVINATGMGKDRPGSPVTDNGLFPMHGIAWELNYRGELAFLHQAQFQAQQRDLAVHDGWHYFVNSWADNIAEVFHIKVTPEQFKQLAEKAEKIRP
jgi:shikimate dehydrogenase